MKKYYLRLFYDFLQSKGMWDSFKQNRRYFRTTDVPFIPEISVNEPRTWLVYIFPWYMNSEVEHQQWKRINEEWEKAIRFQLELNVLNIRRTEWIHQGHYSLKKYVSELSNFKQYLKEYENRIN